MNIFISPLDKIAFDDIVAFCQQGISEGINIDYKEDFPSPNAKLAQTVSAFANTYGGLILIGVKDKDSKPFPPFNGIKHEDKLEERVWNIILDNIYPPVFPEIKVCQSDADKAFVLIRVPESNETPHAIYNKTGFYIRTGNRNKLEDLATLEQIEWLLNRRKKSEELREKLYERAEERYNNLCERKNVRIGFGEFTLSFVPLYPHKPIFGTEETENAFEQLSGYTENRGFTWLHRYYLKTQPVQDGTSSFYRDSQSGLIAHTEINKFGLIFYKEDVGWTYKKEEGQKADNRIYIDRIFGILDVFFEAVAGIYEKAGHWGPIDIRFSLSRLSGINIVPLIPKNTLIFREVEGFIKTNEAERRLSWHLVSTTSELRDCTSRQNKLIELGQDISWSFGLKISAEIFKNRMREQKRWVEEGDSKLSQAASVSS